MPANAKSNELRLTRVLDAPVALVWEAWTDPEQTAKWWGPRGFSITTHSKDLRPGGHWHYTMHGPDGTDYPNRTTYLEVEEGRRLVYDHGAYEDRPPLFRVTVLFKDLGDQTEMQMTMACATPEQAEQTRKLIKDAGGNSTWDRLAEFLTRKYSKHEVFIINRSFAAPIETVFDMWVNAGHFSRWLGPADTEMEFIDDKIAAGSTTFFKMTYATGLTMYGKMSYLKIERPHCIEYTQVFCDENGNLSKHPNVPVWPERMLTRVRLSAEGASQTRVTVTWQPDGTVSREELQAFIDMRTGMTQGWTESFDKLESYAGDAGVRA